MTYRWKTTGAEASNLGGRSSQQRSLGLLKAFTTCLAAVVVFAGFAACGADDVLPPRGQPADGGGGAAGGSSGEGGSGGVAGNASDDAGVVGCVEGAKKECTVKLGEHGGVVSCYKGVQVCVNGAWGICGEGKVSLMPIPGSGSSEKPGGPSNVLVNCVNNPCDPSCQDFDEDPDGGLKPTSQTPIFTWETGDLGNYPPGLVNKGIKEPCSEGEDCQFNQFCSAPVFGTCEHNKCAEGEAMTGGCDPCVDSICAIDQTCCKTTYGGTCAHDYCATGTKLTDGCDTCVSAICDADPKCCGLATQGTCSHDYCSTTGAALIPGCHPCVAEICVDEPKCCDFTPGTQVCAHDYCVTGTKLNANCDPCVAAVCAAKPSCCTGGGNAWNAACVSQVAISCQANDKCPSPKWSTSCKNRVGTSCGNTCTSSWGATCTDKVGSVCGKSCGPFQWDQGCADMVETVCNAKCYDDPPCSHNKCDSGGPLSAACDSCVASICQQLPDCCNVEWTNLCVDRVKTLCGEGCPVKGDCVPWLPGQTDPNCNAADLSIGVPCGSTVPVCNHGNATAPAGVRIIHFPANSNQYPKCVPDQTHPQMVSCTTSVPIPPGKCINVSAAACGLGNGNREIMVNPPPHNGSTQIAECQCSDNWSLWSGPNVACKAPSCSNTTTTTVKRVNMFVALDRSGSMTTSLGNGDTRWSATVKALVKFFQDPGSAGLGAALRFWPDNSPVSGCNDTSCNATACKSPLVNVGVLTLASAPADTQEQLLVSTLNAKSPSGNTPMYPALDGATQWAIAYKAANPTQDAIVVFATDGDPNGCNEDTTAISDLAGAAFNTYGIKTYTIGIQDASPTFMNMIASKGGTKQGYFVSAGGNVENELLAALIQIKGDTLNCDFVVPSGGVYDPSAAKITFTPTVGAPVSLNNVGSLAQCGTGWYYDNPANPAQLKLCPSTCQAVLADSGAKISVDLGCPGGYDPATFNYKYTASCPAGTKVQWGYLAYDTLTAADTSVVWKARTATTLAGLANATYATLATAQASPNTQVCAMAGPAPCPIDLYAKLGLPAARQENLELSITLNPASNKSAAAIVKGWDLTYSCPPSE